MLYLPDIKCAIAMQINADSTSGKVKMPPMRVVMGIVDVIRNVLAALASQL